VDAEGDSAYVNGDRVRKDEVFKRLGYHGEREPPLPPREEEVRVSAVSRASVAWIGVWL
jgi:hypothetical protein